MQEEYIIGYIHLKLHTWVANFCNLIASLRGGGVPILCWFISEGRTYALDISSLSEWFGETFDSNLAWNMLCEAKATFLIPEIKFLKVIQNLVIWSLQ